jgi:mannose-1-phosphate guanylyltransferase
MEAQTWAIVLAGGDGVRLRSLTTNPDGVPVPKQFCSLLGGPTLLSRTLDRAERLCGSRVTTILTANHEPWWRAEFRRRPRGQRVVQPSNAGTAAGILLPLLWVLDQDPSASVVLLPSDHFIGDEAAFRGALRIGLEHVGREPQRTLLLGLEPEHPEPDYGWIVPENSARGAPARVRTFVEKPPIERARRLQAAGGLWNSFVTIARGGTLLGLFARTIPELLRAFLEASPTPDGQARLYADLMPLDFSRHVLQACCDDLDVLAVPPCGWTDLGTPERVRECRARTQLVG